MEKSRGSSGLLEEAERHLSYRDSKSPQPCPHTQHTTHCYSQGDRVAALRTEILSVCWLADSQHSASEMVNPAGERLGSPRAAGSALRLCHIGSVSSAASWKSCHSRKTALSAWKWTGTATMAQICRNGDKWQLCYPLHFSDLSCQKHFTQVCLSCCTCPWSLRQCNFFPSEFCSTLKIHIWEQHETNII